ALVRPRALGAADVARLVDGHWSSRCRHAPPGLRSPAHSVRRARLASHLLHDGDGALADQRDGHGLGAHTLAPVIVKELAYQFTRCARCAAPPPSPLTVVPP